MRENRLLGRYARHGPEAVSEGNPVDRMIMVYLSVVVWWRTWAIVVVAGFGWGMTVFAVGPELLPFLLGGMTAMLVDVAAP